jgi:hypothetical protein
MVPLYVKRTSGCCEELLLYEVKAGLSGGLRPTAPRRPQGRRPSPGARWSASYGLNCQSRPSMLG